MPMSLKFEESIANVNFTENRKAFVRLLQKQLSRIKEEFVSPVEIILYSHLETFGRGTRKDR